MRIILFFFVAAFASLGGTGAQPLAQGVEITFEQSGLWKGTWLTAESSIEDNVYHMLSITEANARSFTYELEDRPVPYGPNAIWSEGTAQFRNALEAVDAEAGRTFVLRVDPGDRQQRVIEVDGEAFLFDGPGVGVPAVDLPTPPSVGPAVTTPIEDDHGDTGQSATPIGSNSNNPGILTSGDVDYFRVDLSEAGTLQTWTSGDVDTVGDLETSDGLIVASSDDSGPGLNFEMNENVPGGTYYIRVAGYSDSDTGSYTLHVRPTQQALPIRDAAEEALPIHDITWFADHFNEDGEWEQWQIIFDQGVVPLDGAFFNALEGTFNFWLVASAEDPTLIRASHSATVTGTYNYPQVAWNWMMVFGDGEDETYECYFGGVMQSDWDAIIGGLVCEGEGESIDRQLRFLRTYG